MASLYIHIPFCKQRCIYCDFYFVTTHRSTTPFVEAVKKEMLYWGDRYGQVEPVETIYFGGGTPSMLPVESIDDLLYTINSVFDTKHVSEITLELNPDDAVGSYLHDLSQTDVNRLSIGVQSFHERDLKWMSRAHSQRQAYHVIYEARKHGFENLSIDLIFGIPGQSLNDWIKNLSIATELRVPHLSTYSLTVEPRTVLSKRIQMGLEQNISDERLELMYAEAMRLLRDQGYSHYEVSSFTLPGYRSQHNQVYWSHRNYLGFGPSAHSFWQNENHPPVRWANISNLRTYVSRSVADHSFIAYKEQIEPAEMLDEHIMLRLRTRDGLDLNHLRRTFGTALEEIKKETIHRLLQAGLVEFHGTTTLRLTDKGFLVCDAVTQELLV